MRPRITQTEARYIVELLEANTLDLKKKQADLERLRSNVSKLRGIVLVSAYDAAKLGITEKKQRLQELERIEYSLYSHLDLHNKLLQKYRAIAEGQPHDGRYKKLSTSGSFWNKHVKPLENIYSVDTTINAEEEKAIDETYNKMKSFVPNKNNLLGLSFFHAK